MVILLVRDLKCHVATCKLCCMKLTQGCKCIGPLLVNSWIYGIYITTIKRPPQNGVRDPSCMGTNAVKAQYLNLAAPKIYDWVVATAKE